MVDDEAELLRSGGHDVHVMAPFPDGSDTLSRVQAGLSAVWSPQAAKRVTALVQRWDVDVVHVHNLFPTLSPAVLEAARHAGATVVMTLHNYRLMCLPATFLRDGSVCESCLGRIPWRGVRYRCYRGSVLGSAALAGSLTLHRGVRTFDAVSRYLAVSDFVREKYIEGGLAAGRIRVKDNFTWPGARRDGPGEYFLFMGRLSSEKGADTLLHAWRHGESLGRLLVVGDGPEAEALRLNAPPGVEFIGSVPPAEVPALLARARALLVPSRWYEASPRTIIEAYAAGVPVIASGLGALPEVVKDGISGYVVPPDDAGAWAEAAGRLLHDDTSEKLGAGAFRLWAERHTPEWGLRGLESAYGEALESV